MVGDLYHVEVVLDDEDRIALIGELLQNLYEPVDIGCVETRGRLIEDIDSPAGSAFGELGRELDTLSLAAREGSRRLTYPDIAKTYVLQCLQLLCYPRDMREELHALVNGHFEYVVNGLALVVYLERFAVVALALADLAGNVDIREEVHFYLDDAVALAGLTASASHVEGKSSGGISPCLSIGSFCEKLAYIAENAGIGRGI